MKYNFLNTKLIGVRLTIIMLIPVFLLQMITIYIFYQRHWDNVISYMEQSLFNEIEFIYKNELDKDFDSKMLAEQFGFKIYYNNTPIKSVGDLTEFGQKLSLRLKTEIHMIYDTQKNNIIASVKIDPNKFLNISFSKKRIESSTTYIFVLWVIISSIVLFTISFFFMRGQIKSIKKLSDFAKRVGRGVFVKQFNPSGSMEVRELGAALMKMQNRLLTHVKNRTEFLAHISHDIATPITRIKLQIEFLKNEKLKNDISKNLDEMNSMLKSYLEFAKQEGNELLEEYDIKTLTKNIVDDFKHSKYQKKIKFLSGSDSFILKIRKNAYKRSVDNLLNNAVRYSKNSIIISITKNTENISLIVEDDGDGIKENDYEWVLKPFNKLNSSTENYGLGLAIVNDFAASMGGSVTLQKSKKLGGLKVSIIIPL